MTDLIDRAVGPPRDDVPPPAPPTSDAGDGVAPFLRYLMAACLLGAAAIHLAMVPDHTSEWAAEGVAFLATAWVQIGLGVALLVRPRRWMVWAALVSSVLFVAAWAWTRLWGPPFGPQSGLTEEAGFVDVSCVVLEGVAALVAGLALYRPRLTSRWSAPTLVVASVIPVAALVAGSLAIASPSASEHAHGSAGTEEAHDHGESEEADDLGLSLLSNGHHHDIVWKDLDPATQAELDRQLDITREVAELYPTVAAAEAAGYTRAGPYAPGLGTHYTKTGPEELNPSGVMTDEALRHPLSLIFYGSDPTSELVGFMYYSMSAVEPTGFVGTNDVWHTHTNVCVTFGPDGVVDSPLGADLEVTEEQCEAAGAVLMPATQWMVHVWTVPGWDNVDGGPFAEVNPKVACSDGTYFRLPPDEWPDNLLNVCRSKAPGPPADDV